MEKNLHTYIRRTGPPLSLSLYLSLSHTQSLSFSLSLTKQGRKNEYKENELTESQDT